MGYLDKGDTDIADQTRSGLPETSKIQKKTKTESLCKRIPQKFGANSRKRKRYEVVGKY